MTGRHDHKAESVGSKRDTAKRGDEIVARNARSKAHMTLAAALATVLSAGVYTKEELQTAVCTFVAEMKDAGESSEGVVRAAQGLVNEVGTRYPSTERTQHLLTDMVNWCLAEYYREIA